MPQEQDRAITLISKIKTLNVNENGIRIIANLHSLKTPLLVEFKAFKTFLEKETKQYKDLSKSAEFYHNFSGEGFAGIDCFRSSHISVRTYPGVNDIVFDLFLSNDLPENDLISKNLYEKTVAFFDSRVVKEKVVKC